MKKKDVWIFDYLYSFANFVISRDVFYICVCYLVINSSVYLLTSSLVNTGMGTHRHTTCKETHRSTQPGYPCVGNEYQ